ncbi:MFS transporter [Novosphingobium sp. KA1]|uniref:MFS transporter n=1 Tax=Novosphingobium sp. (strain KA1) TaxID=164608 RepID=UPI001A8C5CCF|nr:MFS transporter [Novosphingobium sp. KA1]
MSSPQSTGSYRRTALIVAAALFMQNLDATVLATALPTMAREFAVPPAEMSLALTGYLLALAVFIPASGPVADRFGGRRTFQAAIGLFVGGSVLCGFAPTLSALVAARFVQGIGGAMMVPVGRLVLLRSVEKHELVAAMAWLTMPAMIGPIIGPPVGGAIVTLLDWHWIFWINVPTGLVGMLMVGRHISDEGIATPRPFDRLGFLLCALTLAPLIFGLQLAGRSTHIGLALALLCGGLVALAAYLVHARRTAHPLLDITLLRIATFRLSILGGGLIRVTQGAMPFLMPMLLQFAFGLSAAASGGVTLATALGSFTMKGVARRVLRRFGFRATLAMAGVLLPLTYALAGFIGPDWPLPAIFGLLAACGFLASLLFTAYNTIAYADVSPECMSRATSFYATFQQLSLSLGICAGASMLGLAMRTYGHTLPEFSDFRSAIWAVCAVSLLALIPNLALPRDAGAELSGHRKARGGVSEE